MVLNRFNRVWIRSLASIGSAVLLTDSAAAQVEDTTPPDLVDFSFTPALIDVSDGPQAVTVSLRVTDNPAGLQFGSVSFRSPSQQQSQGVSFGAFELISGDAQDGVYETAATFPQFSEAGIWQVRFVSMTDAVNNNSILFTGDLAALGFPNTLEVRGGPDISSPELIDFSLTPSIDVSNGPQAVTVSLRVTDNPAGLQFGSVSFRSPSQQQSQGVSFGAFELMSGDAQDGVYETAATFPQFSEAGTWQVRFVSMTDAVNNNSILFTGDLAALGFPTHWKSSPSRTIPTAPFCSILLSRPHR